MSRKKLKDFYTNKVRLRKCNNVVEAAQWTSVIRKFTGTTLCDLINLPGNRVVAKFTWFGFLCFLIWNSLYVYCTFITYYHDQTILRMLYKTKLKRYGDDFERFTSLAYVTCIIMIIPVKLSANSGLFQRIVDSDLVIEKAGYILNYNKDAIRAITLTVGQCCVYVIRMACVWTTLTSTIVLPIEKVYQVIHSDALAVVTTSLYCYFVLILGERFAWINKTLNEIKLRNSWEYKVFVRGKVPANMVKVVELQDRHICDKIKTCARVYSMLFDTCEHVNEVFGFALLITMLQYFNYVILYLFYFMEATASGLFHDVKRYFDFVVFTFWEIIIAIGIIFLIVVFSEATMTKAKKTCFLVHTIINDDLSPSVTQEAMQFSIQLLHQKPVFSACGLIELTYPFLQQGARSSATYLIILLQFVTENKNM